MDNKHVTYHNTHFKSPFHNTLFDADRGTCTYSTIHQRQGRRELDMIAGRRSL